eukprot:XP_019919359.1 PREDICTED: uncharacterized protein LOC105319516 [Crassostrea gigas]
MTLTNSIKNTFKSREWKGHWLSNFVETTKISNQTKFTRRFLNKKTRRMPFTCTRKWSCGYLGKHISAEETLYNQISISKNGSQICCLEDRSLASLARKVLKIGDSEKPIDKDTFSWWRERPNSAHLYLKDLYRTQLHWTATEETGSAFSKLSIVDQNKLVIKKTANYFVYAAVVFDFRTVTKVPQVYYNITSFLPVLPHLQPFVLMGKNGGSPFSEKRHTGYLCGISKFYKGHQISVSVNDHSFIDNTPYANFFGIFRL